ncbi:response regulator transcription factor [Streptomyces sp. HM190]|uniref:response regulator transcription factor n=1 Tax=Streptomyces sp. HM190 TaxID=2695266 RepID=UPI001F30D144|nr:LuxR C-terminal-related transcriptional regulator [Streptomyces sp. HM190]
MAGAAPHANAPTGGPPRRCGAQNRTNTEIAELLHLARRTVETHPTSTYRKLGIRRRAELTAALTPPPAPRTGALPPDAPPDDPPGPVLRAAEVTGRANRGEAPLSTR